MEDKVKAKVDEKIVELEAEILLQEVLLDTLKNMDVKGAESQKVAQSIQNTQFQIQSSKNFLANLKDKFGKK